LLFEEQSIRQAVLPVNEKLVTKYVGSGAVKDDFLPERNHRHVEPNYVYFIYR
jgi:hypothetical protein